MEWYIYVVLDDNMVHKIEIQTFNPTQFVQTIVKGKMQLSRYIQSNIPNTFADKKLPKKWVQHHSRLNAVHYAEYKKINTGHAEYYKINSMPQLETRISQFAPYLSKKETKLVCWDIIKNGYHMIPTPPLLVKDSFHNVDIFLDKKNNIATLKLSSHKVIKKSPISKYGITRNGWADRAMKYAENNWAEVLENIEKYDGFEFIMINPEKVGLFVGRPNFSVYTTFKTSNQNPLSITHCPIINREIVEFSDGDVYCVFCGDCLSPDECKICEIESLLKCSFIERPPIPPVIFSYLQENEKNIRQIWRYGSKHSVVPDIAKYRKAQEAHLK